MTSEPTAGHAPADATRYSERASARIAGEAALRPSRPELLYGLLALLPVSALLAYAVLQVMASSAAAATGGCGGG